MIGTSNKSLPVAWPLKFGHSHYQVVRRRARCNLPASRVWISTRSMRRPYTLHGPELEDPGRIQKENHLPDSVDEGSMLNIGGLIKRLYSYIIFHIFSSPLYSCSPSYIIII